MASTGPGRLQMVGILQLERFWGELAVRNVFLCSGGFRVGGWRLYLPVLQNEEVAWRSVRPRVSLLLCLFLDEESDSGWAFWNVVAVETLHPHRRCQRWLLPLQDAGVRQSCSPVRRLAVWRTNHGDRQLLQVHKTISGSIVYALKVFCFVRIDPVLCRKQLIAMATALESISRALREREWARRQRVTSNAVYQITLSLANFNKSSERKKTVR